MQDRMNRMNRFFREANSPEGPEEALTTTALAPPVDIYEDEHNIILKIEVPGIDEKDIDVSIQNNTLTVRGERKIEKEEKEENFHRVERPYGMYGPPPFCKRKMKMAEWSARMYPASVGVANSWPEWNALRPRPF